MADGWQEALSARERRRRCAAHLHAARRACRAAAAATWALPEVEEASGHDPLVRDIYAALQAGKPLPSTASDASRSFEIVTAIYSSAASGSPVTPETLRTDAHRLGSLESPVVDLRRA